MQTTLTDSVAAMLSQQDPEIGRRFAKDAASFSTDLSQELRDINRYWRSQLSRLPVSTISARSCLVDDIAPRDWLRHFRTYVMPVIVNHNLPS